MAYFIYKLNSEKVVETENNAKLNAEIISLQGTVNNLQARINSISDTINTVNTTEASNNSAVTNIKNNQTEQIIKFLTSGKIISPKSSLGSGNPEMYYFLANGKFAYMNVPYFTNEGQTISSIGTWEIKDNNLILNIEHAKQVKGGKIVKATASAPYDHLEDYTEEVSNSAYTKK